MWLLVCPLQPWLLRSRERSFATIQKHMVFSFLKKHSYIQTHILVCVHPPFCIFCDSGTSLCPGNGLVGVNKPQKKGSPKANQSPVPKIRVSHTPENNNQRKTNQTRKGLTRNLGRQQAARLVPTNLAAARGLFLPRDAVGRRRGSATPIRGATEPKS